MYDVKYSIPSQEKQPNRGRSACLWRATETDQCGAAELGTDELAVLILRPLPTHPPVGESSIPAGHTDGATPGVSRQSGKHHAGYLDPLGVSVMSSHNQGCESQTKQAAQSTLDTELEWTYFPLELTLHPTGKLHLCLPWGLNSPRVLSLGPRSLSDPPAGSRT